MKRKRHTPDQIIRKLRVGEQMLAEGRDVTDVIRHLEISEPIPGIAGAPSTAG